MLAFPGLGQQLRATVIPSLVWAPWESLHSKTTRNWAVIPWYDRWLLFKESWIQSLYSPNKKITPLKVRSQILGIPTFYAVNIISVFLISIQPFVSIKNNRSHVTQVIRYNLMVYLISSLKLLKMLTILKDAKHLKSIFLLF